MHGALIFFLRYTNVYVKKKNKTKETGYRQPTAWLQRQPKPRQDADKYRRQRAAVKRNTKKKEGGRRYDHSDNGAAGVPDSGDSR